MLSVCRLRWPRQKEHVFDELFGLRYHGRCPGSMTSQVPTSSRHFHFTAFDGVAELVKNREVSGGNS
jgi:hypothetical protein